MPPNHRAAIAAIVLLASSHATAQTRTATPPPAAPTPPAITPVKPAVAPPQAVAPTLASPQLEVGQAVATYGTQATLRATLKTSTGPVANQDLRFAIDGQGLPYPTKTSATGEATYPVKVETDLAPGDHAVTVQFAGGSGMLPATGTGRLNVIKGASKMEPFHAYVGVLKPGTPVALEAKGTLRRTTDSAAIVGRAVEIFVNGLKVGTTATGPDGSFEFQQPWTKGAGTFQAQANFTGDARYSGSGGQGTLTYTPPPPPKTVPAHTLPVAAFALGAPQVGSKVRLWTKVSLVKNGSQGLPGVRVRFSSPSFNFDAPGMVRTDTHDATSGPDGAASVDIPLEVGGTNQFRAEIDDAVFLDGDKTGVINPSAKLEVIMGTVTLHATGPASVTTGGQVQLTVTAKDAATQAPAKLMKLKVRSGGVDVGSGQVAQNGTATVYVTAKPTLGIGAKTLAIEFEGDPRYKPASITHAINVLPQSN